MYKPLSSFIPKKKEQNISDILKPKYRTESLKSIIYSNKTTKPVISRKIKDIVFQKKTSKEDILLKNIISPPKKSLKDILKSPQIKKDEKTDVQVIREILVDDKIKDKPKIIVEVFSKKLSTKEDRETIIKKAYKIIIDAAKPLVYFTVAITASSILLALANIAITGGSWLTLLYILKNLGIYVVPELIIKILEKAGYSIAAGVGIDALILLAERNNTVKNILSKQIKPKTIVNIFSRFGINVNTVDMSVKNLSKIAISNGISLATGDLRAWFISTGLRNTKPIISTSLKTATMGIKTASINLIKTKQFIANSILGQSKKKTDVISLSQKAVSTLKTPSLTGDKKVKRAKPTIQTIELEKSADSMIKDNKLLAFSGAVAVSLTTLALTSDTTTMVDIMNSQLNNMNVENLSPIITSGINFVKENDSARQALFSIISSKINAESLIKRLGINVTSNNVNRLKRKLRKPYKPSRMDKIMSILRFEALYSSDSLNNTDIRLLRYIANKKGIKNYKEASKKSLIDSILKIQTEELSQFKNVISNIIFESTKSVLVTKGLEMGWKSVVKPDVSIPEITTQPQKNKENLTQIKQQIKVKTDQELEIEKDITRKELNDAAKKLIDEQIKKLREKQKALSEKSDFLKQETERKALAKIAKRKLKEALLDREIEKVEIAITNAEGINMIPKDNDLLNPKMRKALDIEFTPLGQYLAMEAAKSTVSFVPGVGWIQSIVNKVNMGITVAEKTKDVYNIVNAIMQITSETGESLIDIGNNRIEGLNSLLKNRIPSLNTAVDNYVELEKVNLKVLVLTSLRNKILFNRTNNQMYYEIAKNVIVGKKASKYTEEAMITLGKTLFDSSTKKDN